MHQRLLAIIAAVALAGCSAGGKSSSTTSTTTTSAADLVVTLDKTSLTDSGSDTATITVTAVDASRNVVAAVPVSIVPESTSGAVITPSGSTTSSTGILTGVLGIGSDHSNRKIAVVVKSGSITKTVSVQVTGAILTANAVSGTAGSTASVVYHLVDSTGTNLSGMPITVAADGMATVADKTDGNGNYTYSYVVPSTATLNISATAGGVTTVSTVTISASSTPAASGTPMSESIAANPSSVSVNTASSTTNQVEVRALFLGSGNSPISNIRVRFDLDGDVNNIGGTLSSGSNYVYTDSNGVARTTYIPGTRGSGDNAVTIRACWSVTDFAAGTCPNTTPNPAQVTVTDSGVSVSVFTNSTITIDDTKLVYTIPFAVQIVDSANNPQSGVKVNALAHLPRYYRGYWGNLPVTTTTNGTTTTTTKYSRLVLDVCDNEDINGNKSLEASEDVNASGKLEPYAADVTILPTSTGSDTTDSVGKAYFTMQYGQNVASWDDYILTFSAVIQSTEGSAAISGTLPVPNSAVANAATVTPPFELSPYNLAPPNEEPVAVGTASVTNTATPAVTFNVCKKQN